MNWLLARALLPILTWLSPAPVHQPCRSSRPEPGAVEGTPELPDALMRRSSKRRMTQMRGGIGGGRGLPSRIASLARSMRCHGIAYVLR